MRTKGGKKQTESERQGTGNERNGFGKFAFGSLIVRKIGESAFALLVLRVSALLYKAVSQQFFVFVTHSFQLPRPVATPLQIRPSKLGMRSANPLCVLSNLFFHLPLQRLPVCVLGQLLRPQLDVDRNLERRETGFAVRDDVFRLDSGVVVLRLQVDDGCDFFAEDAVRDREDGNVQNGVVGKDSVFDFGGCLEASESERRGVSEAE